MKPHLDPVEVGQTIGETVGNTGRKLGNMALSKFDGLAEKAWIGMTVTLGYACTRVLVGLEHIRRDRQAGSVQPFVTPLGNEFASQPFTTPGE